MGDSDQCDGPAALCFQPSNHRMCVTNYYKMRAVMLQSQTQAYIAPCCCCNIAFWRDISSFTSPAGQQRSKDKAANQNVTFNATVQHVANLPGDATWPDVLQMRATIVHAAVADSNAAS